MDTALRPASKANPVALAFNLRGDLGAAIRDRNSVIPAGTALTAPAAVTTTLAGYPDTVPLGATSATAAANSSSSSAASSMSASSQQLGGHIPQPPPMPPGSIHGASSGIGQAYTGIQPAMAGSKALHQPASRISSTDRFK